jgi:hypothetical protein
LSILEKQKSKWQLTQRLTELVFSLPSQDGSNNALETWMDAAGIKKHITWSCVRLIFSILLQDKNVDDATVAYLMGHMTTEQVRKTYKRHRPKSQSSAISNLPSPAQMESFTKHGECSF